MTIKQLPDEKTLLEILDLARDFEQSTREMCEMSTAIAHKYQQRGAESPQAATDQPATEESPASTGSSGGDRHITSKFTNTIIDELTPQSS